MCAINGIFAYHYAATPIRRDELIRTRDHMAARGPDGCGDWISDDEHVGLGHRRLAIIDLSDAGAQPMASADERYRVVFNGEIYNYRQLREDLEAKGCRFASNSDTEVLIHLFATKGEEMVKDLRGMFAFAIWDERERRLFLARDPYGIKPLYYSDDGWTVRFASQVKALLAGGQVSRELDAAGQVGFYLWGNVPEPFTTYRQIQVLPAGCTAVVDRIGLHAPKRYHSIAAALREAAESHAAFAPADGRAMMGEALLGSVKRHLVSDVPVGAFLSAGIDSGSLVGLMRDAGAQDIETVTLAFDEYRGTEDDEATLAAEVARAYGVRHSTRVVTQAEFMADLPLLLDAMDQPSIDGINSWFVSKAARELGLKVAISGLGGDELLGGYPSFQSVPRWQRLARAPSRIPFLGRAFRGTVAAAGRVMPTLSPKAAGFLELGGTYPGAYLMRRGVFMPWELGAVLDPDTVRRGLARLKPLALVESEIASAPNSAFAKVSALESSIYMRNQLLRDADWASMAHSLEVRVPLVDHTLLSTVAPYLLRDGHREGKRLLAAAPAGPLPERVLTRAKTGFTTPIGTWLQSQYDGAYADVGLLAFRHCRWARRWSYIIANEFGFSRASPEGAA